MTTSNDWLKFMFALLGCLGAAFWVGVLTRDIPYWLAISVALAVGYFVLPWMLRTIGTVKVTP